MKVLDRYILKNFLISYLILAFVLIGLYVLADLTINGQDFTKQQDAKAGDVVGEIANYYGHQVFAYYRELAGIITLASAIVTLISMNRRNEMTALLASGVSLYRVIWPVLVLGLVFTGLSMADQELVLPSMADELVRHHDQQAKLKEFPIYACGLRDAWSIDDVAAVRVVRKGGDGTARLVLENIGAAPGGGGAGGANSPVLLVCQSRAEDVLAIHAGATEQVRLYVRITRDANAPGESLDSLAVTAKGVSQEGYAPDFVRAGSAADLSAVQPGDRVTPAIRPQYLLWAVKLVPDLTRHYRLQEKLVLLKKNGKTGDPIVRIDADSAEWQEAEGAWKIAKPVTTFMRASSGDGQGGATRIEREALLVYSDNTPREIVLRNSSQRWMQYMSTPDLLEYSRSRDSGATVQARSIMHIRLTQPIINMILLLLGVPFALTRAPVNLIQGMLRCVLLSGSCFICSFIFQQVSSDAQTWAIVAAWLPVIVYAPLAVLMLDSVKT